MSYQIEAQEMFPMMRPKPGDRIFDHNGNEYISIETGVPHVDDMLVSLKSGHAVHPSYLSFPVTVEEKT